MPFYAIVEVFMPIGLPVQKLKRFDYCGILAKKFPVMWFFGFFRVPWAQKKLLDVLNPDVLIYNKPRILSYHAC
jgi:hypothetical protein